MLEELDAAAVRRWAGMCVDVLAAHRQEIDRINVFPVADADTGTNLLLTMRAAVDELRRGAGPAPGFEELAHGALLGARGNSGLVLCQVLRGLARGCGQAPALTAAGLVEGLRLGADLATAAFASPVAGTALTVLSAAAQAADAAGWDKLAACADAAVGAAAAALAETPRELPVLARAGVVDAGGRGVLLVLEALAAVVSERALSVPGMARLPRAPSALRAVREAGSAAHEYEVMYLLDGSGDDRVAALRAELTAIGDSVAVVGDGGLWSVHVHCTDVGAAIEAGVEAGRPHRITVIRFAGAAPAGAGGAGRAVVALVEGDGLARLFRGEGVAVVTGRPGSAADVLSAITGTRAGHVVVLPNSRAATAVAEAAATAARDAGHDVVVVPTASPVQGLAALAVHDPARRAGDDVVTMAEAAAATRCGALTIAEGEALSWAGRCQPGDVLGLVDGEVVLIARDLTDAAGELIERMLGAGGELVTALLGAGAPGGLGAALTTRLRRSHPEVELVVYDGGLADHPLLVGVEQ